MNLSRSLDVPALLANEQVHLRPVVLEDSGALAAAYVRNAEHLSPWEPRREPSFFSVSGQEKAVQSKLQQYAAGREVPWVLVRSGMIVGTMTLTGIVRGPFLSANLGYWVDSAHAGKGLAKAAVGAVLDMAGSELGLHRVQAATLVHNAASQAVLKRSGFERIGLAPSYLKIDGKWQDHVLYQRILH
ncbi:GNAT family N-acetyltransferase [Paenarthrobacter sp. NPDC090520]|uniref:GNAT family N-acetyltransferase n=1 Tax=Paenarthrobacter sp. NPDC090520 TaxID=3364382 RepID=UPI00380559ED